MRKEVVRGYVALGPYLYFLSGFELGSSVDQDTNCTLSSCDEATPTQATVFEEVTVSNGIEQSKATKRVVSPIVAEEKKEVEDMTTNL